MSPVTLADDGSDSDAVKAGLSDPRQQMVICQFDITDSSYVHPTSVETGVVIVRDGLPLSGHLDSGEEA